MKKRLHKDDRTGWLFEEADFFGYDTKSSATIRNAQANRNQAPITANDGFRAIAGFAPLPKHYEMPRWDEGVFGVHHNYKSGGSRAKFVRRPEHLYRKTI